MGRPVLALFPHAEPPSKRKLVTLLESLKYDPAKELRKNIPTRKWVFYQLSYRSGYHKFEHGKSAPTLSGPCQS